MQEQPWWAQHAPLPRLHTLSGALGLSVRTCRPLKAAWNGWPSAAASTAMFLQMSRSTWSRRRRKDSQRRSFSFVLVALARLLLAEFADTHRTRRCRCRGQSTSLSSLSTSIEV